LLRQKNTTIQGNVGLAIGIQYFTSIGCIVSIPLNDIQDYDLIVDFWEEGIKKVQVKTTTFLHNGKYKVNLKTSNKSFQLNQSDYLFVVDGSDTRYLIPRNEVTTSSAILLNDTYSKYIV
jgi:hypothetical protein